MEKSKLILSKNCDILLGGRTRDKESILSRCATLDIKEFEFWDFKNGKILEFLEFLGQVLNLC